MYYLIQGLRNLATELMSGETHLAPFHMAQEGFNSTAYYRCVVHVVMAIIIIINIIITTTIIITIITIIITIISLLSSSCRNSKRESPTAHMPISKDASTVLNV